MAHNFFFNKYKYPVFAVSLGGALEDDDEEEDFSVISEEEVVLSQCVPYSPNPEILQYWKSCEIQSGLTRSVASLLAANETVSESVWVRAGVIFALPLLLAAGDSNVNVTWEFTTEPKCIAFSVLYKKDADIPTENSSILVPTTRVNSHQHPIKGRLRARREGLYTLMFDNSYSRFTGKKVNFSLSCEAGSGHSSAGPASPLHAAVSKSTAASSDLNSPDQDLPQTD
ncbi:hypothetical protein B566_EDAN012747 [Ephemera danica]|nr:hypothetical protein B566_EDAN012747 [Ephemera danica]